LVNVLYRKIKIVGISGFYRGVFEAFSLLGYYGSLSLLLATDVSGDLIGPIFKGQAILRNMPEERKPYVCLF
jgi:hypothetical protein